MGRLPSLRPERHFAMMFSGSELNHRLRLDPARSGAFPSVAVGLRGVKCREAKEPVETARKSSVCSISPSSAERKESLSREQQRAASILLDMDQLWTPWRYAYVTKKVEGARRGVPEALAAWPGDFGCVFCNLLASTEYAIEHGMSREEAEKASGILERRGRTFLMLNAFPYNSGHLMILPYRHEATLAGLPEEEALDLMIAARRAERALRSVYRPDGLNLGLNLGESAGAGIAEHLHLHAVPRWAGDTNFMTVVGETRVLPELLVESWRRLRAALADDEHHRPEGTAGQPEISLQE